jgi:hypothetical protein
MTKSVSIKRGVFMIDSVIKKIEIEDREFTRYIHPIETNETIAKWISAYSNTQGGTIIFGVADDGNKLHIKSFPFEIDESRIRELLDNHVVFHVVKFSYMNKKLAYIQVEKNNVIVKAKGVTYNLINNRDITKLIPKRIFISYSHNETDIADIVEKTFIRKWNSKIKISRDINELKYKDSLDKFMKSIKEHDYIISIVSNAYLRSIPCMYEISELMRDRDYYRKLLFIIINEDDKQYYKRDVKDIQADIYTLNRFDYITYWEHEKEKIDSKLSEIKNPALTSDIAKLSKKIEVITLNIEDFISKLNDGLGVNFEEMLKSDFQDFIKIILGQEK